MSARNLISPLIDEERRVIINDLEAWKLFVAQHGRIIRFIMLAAATGLADQCFDL